MRTKLKTTLITIAAGLALVGCASSSAAYGPAIGTGLGFASQQIESDRFQVSFTGRNADEARNYALLRAAELTKGQGYSHFRVVGSSVEGDQHRSSPISTSIGIGIGSGGRYRRRGGSYSNVGIGIGVNDLARALSGNKVTASMEVVLTNANAQANGQRQANTYAAESIIASIRPAAYTP